MNNIDEIMRNYPELTLYYDIMPTGLCGLIIGNKITIDKELDCQSQYQWLCEELGHYETSVGNISNYSDIESKKQEIRARKRGMEKCVPKHLLDEIVKDGPENDYEVADEIGVQIDYLHKVASMYGYRYR